MCLKDLSYLTTFPEDEFQEMRLTDEITLVFEKFWVNMHANHHKKKCHVSIAGE
jgi:hypothetical protein